MVGFFYGLSGALAKYITGFISPLQASEIRFVGAFLIAFLIAFVFRQKFNLKGHKRVILLIYAIAFPLCVILFTLSIFHGSVALATASAYGSALISSFIFGKIFFEEKVGLLKGIAFGLTLIALFIFTEPWNDFSLSLGLLFGVSSGLLQGISNGVQKKLNKEGADHSSLLLLQLLAGSVLALIVVSAAGEPVVFEFSANPFLIFLYGFSSVATVYLFLVGFKYIDVNTGSILVSTQLFFGPFLAFLFLGEEVKSHLVLGAILVLISAILANWPDQKKTDLLAKG